MSLISFTPIADGVTGVAAAATNNPLNTIYNDYNGNITNANISASAAITGSKLADTSITSSKLSTGATPAFLATSQTTTGTTYAVLATATDNVTVTIGGNGLALVSIYANMSNSSTNNNFMGFALSGTNTVAASDPFSLSTFSTGQYNVGATFLVTGLTAGSTNFACQYRTSAGTATFANRRISVVPL